MDGFKHFMNEGVDMSLEHEIINMYQDRHRYKISDIHEKTGVSVAGIYRILEKYGINPHRTHINNDNAELVNQYAASGTSARRIAELTGYSTRHIYNLLKKGSLAEKRI